MSALVTPRAINPLPWRHRLGPWIVALSLFCLAIGGALEVSTALAGADDSGTAVDCDSQPPAGQAVAERPRWADALLHWRAEPAETIFTGAGPGHWDAKIRERGWIIRDDSGWRLWYTGYDGTRAGIKQLGLATSDDGIAWRRAAEQPLVRDHWVEDMMIVVHDGRYHMFAEGLHDRAQLLISDDGLAWQIRGSLDVRRADGSPIATGPYGTPAAWHDGQRWNLFYERGDQGVWWAQSDDLALWTNTSDQPVMSPGPSTYDDRFIAVNQVLRHGDRWYALYHGSGSAEPGKWCTCLAVSDDLRNWTKYEHNPLLSDNQSSGILIYDGNRLLLYTMHDQVVRHIASHE